MSSLKYPVSQSGIYHNLPTFDLSIRGLTAILCGPSGISGFYALRVLLKSPARWSRVYAVSRSPLPKEMLNLLTEDEQSRLTHISVDLFTSGKQIADAFVAANVKADYVFFYAYMEPKSTKSAMDPSMTEELIKANDSMFDNFLEALPIAGIAPRRILLQTGGK